MVWNILFERKPFCQKNFNKRNTFYNVRENCQKNSSKIFKKLIRRPSFLPSHMELLPQSFIFASENMSKKYTKVTKLNFIFWHVENLIFISPFFKLSSSFQINFLCQIKSDSKIKLSSVSICSNSCSKKSNFILKENQTRNILIFLRFNFFESKLFFSDFSDIFWHVGCRI